MSKISVDDFVSNYSSIEVFYVPQFEKINIVKDILSRFDNEKDIVYDTAALKHVLNNIIVSVCTNIEEPETEGITVWDKICQREHDKVVESFIEGEFKRFHEILASELDDYYKRISLI